MKKRIRFILLAILIAIAGLSFYYFPGMLTGTILIVLLWLGIYFLFGFSDIDPNDWKFPLNLLKLTGSALVACLLTGLLFFSAMKGSSFFWKDLGLNSRHNFLLHDGFATSSQQEMVIAGNPRREIQAGMEGDISLASDGNNINLHCFNAPYPLYFAKKNDQSLWLLQQKGLPQLQTDQQLILKLSDSAGADTIIIRSEKGSENRFKFNISYRGLTDTIENRAIAYGTRFSDLLENTSLPFSYTLIQALQQLYLLKDSIQFITKNNQNRTVYWYYGKDPTYKYWQTKLPVTEFAGIWLENSGRGYDLVKARYQNINIALNDGDKFYLGYEPAAGKQFLDQPAYEVNLLPHDSFALRYLQPQVYPLPSFPEKDNEVFITSNYKFALSHASDFGYILPALNTEGTDSNINHFWGSLRYTAGHAGKDLTDIQFRSNTTLSIKPNIGWIVATPGNEAGWMLHLHNSWVKVEADWQNTLIPVFLVAGALLIFLGLYARIFNARKHSGTPVFFWWLFNCLFFIFLLRLFLSWRIRSYPYTDNINKNEFDSFLYRKPFSTSLGHYSLTANLLIALFFVAAVVIFFGFQFFNSKRKANAKS